MKEKELDNLTRCSIAAEKAGISYGKYMSMLYGKRQAKAEKEQRPAEKPKKVFNPNPKIPVKVCAYCGKEFQTAGRSANCKYCSWECSDGANRERAQFYRRAMLALAQTTDTGE